MSVRALILFVKKKDNILRLCVNYRDLNLVIIKNHYLLSLIDEFLNHLKWAKIFTKLDLTLAYHYIQIKSDDEWKTAFRTWYKHYKYYILSFDLINALSIFQLYINSVLIEKLDVFCIIYLNNILIYSINKQEYEKYVK